MFELKSGRRGFPGARIAFAALVAVAAFTMERAAAEPSHGLAMHGEPALPKDFPHLPYADPDAPKGGKLGYANVGTFDSMNPFIVRGNAPRGLWDDVWGRNVWESLMVRNRAEPFTLYGLLAESVETPPDRSWISFQIRPEARFADGKPVRPEDVIFSAGLLKEQGRPNFRTALGKVAKIEKVGERGVRFDFTPQGDRELPLLIAMMPVFPEHAVDPETFDNTSLTAPMGSGPYQVASVDPGTRAILKRNPAYWGKDLAIKRGTDNFDEISIEYFRDANSFFEGFKKGLFDILPEKDPARWATQYDFPAAQDGRVVQDKFPTSIPKPMKGFVFNTRRPPFDDPRVREALTLFLDFEWMNRALFYGLYERTESYFQGSELSALGVPASAQERELLAPFPDAVRPEIMDGTWRLPESDGSGRNRETLRQAIALLREAGYERRGDVLVDAETGAPLSFEIIVQTREDERLALAYRRALALGGIEARVRIVDAAQYWDRMKGFEFDMSPWTFAASLSPGTEQNFRWSTRSAETEGTWNFAGVRNPAVDAMIAAMLAAESREDFVAAVRALDRVLLSGFYLVPLFHAPEEWMARWSRIEHPPESSLYGPEPTTWWARE